MPFDTGTPEDLHMTPSTPQQQHQLPHNTPNTHNTPAPPHTGLNGGGQGIVHGLDLDRTFEDEKRVKINPDVQMPGASQHNDNDNEIDLQVVDPTDREPLAPGSTPSIGAVSHW